MKCKLTLLLLIYIPSLIVQAQVEVEKAFTHAQTQTECLLQEIPKAQTPDRPDLRLPRSLTPTGELKLTSSKDWTSGFFPGNLWFLYEYTKNDYWRTQAQTFTSLLTPEQFDKSTHDVGFKIYNSFGAGYRLTQNATYRNVIIQAAKSLSTRYNAKVGSIQSWNATSKWRYPVIIDNMMNLELLFAATRLTGNPTYYQIAVNHANTTLKNHFRADNSSWHVVDYDPATGQVRQKNTHQGYSDRSAWARGQAWGLYGFTVCYRETKNSNYLRHAEKIATFILNHPRLPADLVPYWDFDAPLIPNEPRDASAAAIMASALYELSTYSSQGETYRQAADKILTSLSTLYISPVGQNRGFILLHSTGHKPAKSEIDVPLIYADYYYLEALMRKRKLNVAPVLNAIGSLSVTVGQTLSFTASATDANAGQTKTYSLVNAPTGASIHSTTGAFRWVPNQAGTFTFYVRVMDNGSPKLSDQEQITVTVNPVPTSLYSLTVSATGSGTVSKSPNQTTYAAGTTVTLTATPAPGYQFNGWSGAATGTANPFSVTMNSNKNITATFTPVVGQQLTSFTLINADTDQPIRNLLPNDVINIASVKNLNIRANTNPVKVGSVKMILSGPQTANITQTDAPYALFGDAGGNYNAWTPAVGSYTLTGTPYTLSGGGGTAGTPLSINFSVVNTTAAGLPSLTAYPTPTSNGYIQVKRAAAWEEKITYTLVSAVGVKLTAGEINLNQSTSIIEFDFSHQMTVSGIYYLQLESKKQKATIMLMRQ